MNLLKYANQVQVIMYKISLRSTYKYENRLVKIKENGLLLDTSMFTLNEPSIWLNMKSTWKYIFDTCNSWWDWSFCEVWYLILINQEFYNHCCIKEAQNLHQLKSSLSDPSIISFWISNTNVNIVLEGHSVDVQNWKYDFFFMHTKKKSQAHKIQMWL